MARAVHILLREKRGKTKATALPPGGGVFPQVNHMRTSIVCIAALALAFGGLAIAAAPASAACTAGYTCVEYCTPGGFCYKAEIPACAPSCPIDDLNN
jgi:hypothetical protein